jgi:hypothetical protein
MRYAVRVGIGVGLGLAAIVAFHFFVHTWWVAGLLAALLGLIGFLGSFFIWTADRPEEGYEQVLFDMKNNVVSLVLVALLVGGAFGVAHVWAPKAAAAPLDPAVAAMNTQHDKLVSVYNDVQAGKLDASSTATAKKDVQAVQDALKALTTTSPKLDLLNKAATAELTALDAYSGTCGFKVCQAATLALLDAKDPLNQYAGS